MPLAPGQSLSFYEILGPLGAGAMGEVYRARDTRLDREVAIKVLPEHFADDEERLRRFEREAKTLATLNHPNVAQVFGIDQVGDTCFIAMELVGGEGDMLVFGSDRDGQFDLYVAQIDGEPQNLTQGRYPLENDVIRNLGFDRDGSRVWFLKVKVPDSVLLAAPPVELCPEELQVRLGKTMVRFLPDGGGLVYMEQTGSSIDFRVLDLETGQTEPLTELEDAGDIQAFDVTPDGRNLVFDRIQENSDVVLIDRREQGSSR